MEIFPGNYHYMRYQKSAPIIFLRIMKIPKSEKKKRRLRSIALLTHNNHWNIFVFIHILLFLPKHVTFSPIEDSPNLNLIDIVVFFSLFYTNFYPAGSKCHTENAKAKNILCHTTSNASRAIISFVLSCVAFGAVLFFFFCLSLCVLAIKRTNFQW